VESHAQPHFAIYAYAPVHLTLERSMILLVTWEQRLAYDVPRECRAKAPAAPYPPVTWLPAVGCTPRLGTYGRRILVDLPRGVRASGCTPAGHRQQRLQPAHP
jgi:hypothetical protein